MNVMCIDGNNKEHPIEVLSDSANGEKVKAPKSRSPRRVNKKPASKFCFGTVNIM